MQVKTIEKQDAPTCPRCGRQLFVELDPTEGLCLMHGTVVIRPSELPLVAKDEEVELG